MPVVPIKGHVKILKHQPYQIWMQINREKGIVFLLCADTIFSKLCKNIIFTTVKENLSAS